MFSPLTLTEANLCSTLTETRQKACGLVVSFRSLSGLTSCRPSANPLSLTEVNLTGRGTKSVILNSFQDLSFPQSIPHPSPLLLRRGYSSLYKSRRLKVFESFLSIIVRSTVTDYSLFTLLSLFTHLFAPSPVLRTPSPNRERENETFALLVQKEKLFEDNSVSRAKAWSENDFSFRATINPSP